MKYLTLLKANLKRRGGGFFGIFILTLFVSAAVGTVLMILNNSENYIENEMERAGFGELTAWVSGVENMSELTDSIENLSEVTGVDVQSLVFSNYTVNGQESDSEGQLITFSTNENRYKFFADDLSGYKNPPDEISRGEIFVSASMVSMFDVKVGDEVIFPIARAGKNAVFTVKGFYEDPFMGSSMIGMKGFLICEADRGEILSIIQNSGIDTLARDGAMLHIFSSEKLNISELNSVINENTQLAEYTEFVHSKNAIAGFMLVLQNAFSGLLLAFAAVLMVVVMFVLSHNIGSAVEADAADMGILKTVGFTSNMLRKIQLLQYLVWIIPGMIFGTVIAVPLCNIVSGMTVASTGFLMPTKLPTAQILLSFILIIFLLAGFIILRTGMICRITPMKAIRGEITNLKFSPQKTVSAFGRGIHFRLALRRIVTGKRRYIGALATAALLVFFASLTGRMYSWLGSDGKGMMDAFNPADHDIGVQTFGSLTAEEAENLVKNYSEITDTYLLAMPGVAVNGVDYTANVISEPERFHILEGKACTADNEVVLTEFVAANFGVETGDTVTVTGGRGSGEYIVSGIYSCANDMGDNIGMSREGYLKIGKDDPHIWCRHYFLADTSQKAAIAEALENAYGGDVHVHENTWPGLFGIISAMQMLMIIMYGLVIIFIMVVTVMTAAKILSAEQNDLGIYKAIGFGSGSLRLSFAISFGLTALIGSLIGMLLAAAFTDPLVSFVMKFAGISSFSSEPTVGNILLPLCIVVGLFTLFAYASSWKIKKLPLTVLISE